LQTKVDGIEAAADVTDATNVAAAGAPIITSGAGAPSSTPSAVGDIYVDTTGDIGWVATGTASSADWKQATGAGGGDLLAANNLSDVANAATSLTNLGVTAAAQTVTDDVTVAAMVDTLGGASSTGTGGLVRATSPALVTPDLGTPSALVATNATGTAAGLTVGATTGVEAGADVTDATNVAAAGAHMAGGTDVPVTDGGTGASTAAAARTNLDVDQAGTDNAPSASATTAGKVELATIAEVDTGTDTTRAITPAGLAGSALQTKVDGIEAGATADQTTEEIQDIAGPLVATGGTKTGITVTYQDATGDMDFAVDTASTTVAGIAELATAAETSTGTDATRAVTPDGLAGSDFGTKSVCIVPHISTEACAVANGTIGFVVPAAMAGMDLTDCVASVHTAGTTGTMSVMVRRRRATTDADMLSTALTIDSAETSSTTAATAHAINGANDDLNEGDTIYVDIDGIHTTPATGLSVTLSFGVA
jgi:hypothetical protein